MIQNRQATPWTENEVQKFCHKPQGSNTLCLQDGAFKTTFMTDLSLGSVEISTFDMTCVIPNPTTPIARQSQFSTDGKQVIPSVQWLTGPTLLITHGDIINLTIKLTTCLGWLPPEILQTLTFTNCHDQFSAFLIMLKGL